MQDAALSFPSQAGQDGAEKRAEWANWTSRAVLRD